MSVAKTTRKVTIDSGRKVSTSGDTLDQVSTSSKGKSVFDRLGTKANIKKAKSTKYSDESYNSDGGEVEKKKGFVSFTVKKNSLMEDSHNKLHLKKDKKKSKEKEVGDDLIPKQKKKKKQKDEVQAVYSKPPKNKDYNDVEDSELLGKQDKKKKKILLPEIQPSKKKRKMMKEIHSDVDDDFDEGDNDYVKKTKSFKHKTSNSEYQQSESEPEHKEKKKKKKQKDRDVDSSKKNKKHQGGEPLKIKKKSKLNPSGDELSEEEKLMKKSKKRQRSPSWSVSESEVLESSKSKPAKSKTKSKQKSLSESPIKDKFLNDYSSFESDISFESDDEHKKKPKKNKSNVYDKPGDKQLHQRKNFDQRFQQNSDDRNQRGEYTFEKKNESYGRDDEQNENLDDRRRLSYERGYDQGNRGGGNWRANQYEEEMRRNQDQRYDNRANRGNRGRIVNRFDGDRDERGQDYFERREDRRDYRSGGDNEWNIRQDNCEEDRHRTNYRGRGRGRGRGNFRGAYHQQQNENGRFNQQRDYDYDYKYRNQSGDRGLTDERGFQKPNNRYRGGEDDDYWPRNEYKNRDKPYELSPIRDPNFIGAIAKLSSSSEDEEEEKKGKKKKSSEKKKRDLKEKESISDGSDVESKKKQKSKIVKNNDEKVEKNDKKEKVEQQIEKKKKSEKNKKPDKNYENDKDDLKSPRKVSKEKPERKKESVLPSADAKIIEKEKKEKEKEIKATHKRISAVKDMESSSSGRKMPETNNSQEPIEIEEKKKEKKEEKQKRASSVVSLKDERKREHSQEDSRREHRTYRRIQVGDEKIRDRSVEQRRWSPESMTGRHTPDSRREKSPSLRDSPYKRGRSLERNNRHRDSSFSRRDSSYNKDGGEKRDRAPEKNKDCSKSKPAAFEVIEKVDDVYESISDEDLDIFDELDDEFVEANKPVKPVSVMDVDWSMLSKMNKLEPKKESNDHEMPCYLQKLLPGHVLSEIGFSPSLISRKTLENVQDLCLKASKISPKSLDVSEETKLQNGMAITVRNVLKQRHARDDLFTKNLIGLRNDLALRRELRKPLDKVGRNYNVFCSAPANPVDYELFAQTVALYEKKQLTDRDPVYSAIASKVGSIVLCKS